MNRSKARYMLAQAGLIGLRCTPADMTRETLHVLARMRREWGYDGIRPDAGVFVHAGLSEFWALVTTAAYSLPPLPRCECRHAD